MNNGARRVRLLALSASVIGLAAGALWLERAPIAEAVVRRYLESRDVPAAYRIESLGARRVVLTGVRVGDAARPDLVAGRVAVDVAWRNGVPTPVRAVVEQASLNVALGPEGLSLGALDRLLPKSEAPFAFPDFLLSTTGSKLRLATSAGDIEGVFEGQGKLSDGFRGRLVLTPTELRQRDCRLRGVGGTVDVRVVRRVLLSRGALSASGGDCGAPVEGLRADFDLRLPELLDRVDGTLRLAARRVGGADAAARDVTAGLTAAGHFDALRGDWSVAFGQVAGAAAEGRGKASGSYRASLGDRELSLTGAMQAAVAVRRAALGRLAEPVAPAATPLRPLEAHLRTALVRAARHADVRASLLLDWRGGSGMAKLREVRVAAASGLRASLGNDVMVQLPEGRIEPRAVLGIGGGGFPESRLSFERATNGATTAALTMAPWQAGTARAALRNVRATYEGGRGTLDGLIELSGPLADGRVEGLRLPLGFAVDLRRGVRVDSPACVRPSFERLSLSGYRAGRTALNICARPGLPLLSIRPGGELAGGVSLRAPELRVSDGAGETYRVGARLVEAILGGTMAAPRASIRLRELGAGAGGTRLTLAELSGDVARGRTGWSGSGRFSGAGAGGDLPAIFERGQGGWSLAEGVLRLTGGSVLMRDAQPEPRFQPLRLTSVVGALRQGVVSVAADALVAGKGVRLGDVRLRHDLSAGTGRADLKVEGLTFGEAIQPYEVSEIARGIVENVVGPVSGDGVVLWSTKGVESGGSLTLGGVSFATAALGPVDDVRGTIRFDDLLALATPPGQSVTIGRINPGVAVEQGVFRFQLLPNHDVRIEGAEWPFAGGRLTLDPTLFELNATTRRYTLRVASIEAAEFLQQFDFKNLNVTGRFSGVLPLLFEAGRGRIVGGRLVAEQGGGVIQYVGEVGRDSLGAGARLAFDALRKMRYDSLLIELDGALDGEIVTGVRFSGVNEAPVTPGGSSLPVKATGLPFKFNLTVRAPFRALLNSAASFGDVRPIIRSGLPVDPDAVPGVPEAK